MGGERGGGARREWPQEARQPMVRTISSRPLWHSTEGTTCGPLAIQKLDSPDQEFLNSRSAEIEYKTKDTGPEIKDESYSCHC